MKKYILFTILLVLGCQNVRMRPSVYKGIVGEENLVSDLVDFERIRTSNLIMVDKSLFFEGID